MLLAMASLCGVPAEAQSGGSLPGLAGGQLAFADLAQGTHIIVVWASWSPRCRDISPRVNDLVQKLSGEGRVVTVNFQEEAAAIDAFVRQHPLNAPVFLDRDGEFSKGHAVTTLPGLIVVRQGEVLYQGRLAAEAESQIQGLLR
ncbi:MAG: TlpA disulfide reductase family protein [Thermoanaerobaculia bacterium]